jgi:phytoene desaturase (3,4-didehydrolycopene-forming)
VSNALEKLAKELGVEIECGKTVTQVQSDGVWICETEEPDKKDFIRADLIVINADLPYATASILPNDQSPTREEPHFDWDESFSFSSGVISFHWSIDKPLEDLNTHNVFMVAGSRSQAQASWQVLRTNHANLDVDVPFNFYVHRASKTDPTAAPPGCDSIMVLVPCQTLLRDAECASLTRDEAMARYKEQFSGDVISKARQAVLKRLAAFDSLQDLEKHILDEVVDTPATWSDQFNLAAGAPFALVRNLLYHCIVGVVVDSTSRAIRFSLLVFRFLSQSHGFSQLSLTRPGPASSGIRNVLFCGASSRPGNGVPLVLIGAKQVAEKVVCMIAKDN